MGGVVAGSWDRGGEPRLDVSVVNFSGARATV